MVEWIDRSEMSDDLLKNLDNEIKAPKEVDTLLFLCRLNLIIEF